MIAEKDPDRVTSDKLQRCENCHGAIPIGIWFYLVDQKPWCDGCRRAKLIMEKLDAIECPPMQGRAEFDQTTGKFRFSPGYPGQQAHGPAPEDALDWDPNLFDKI